VAARIGIEVSPTACRIVQIERGGADETIVRAYAIADAADTVTLARYRGQRVAAVIWGLQAEHRQVVVNAGSYQKMRREAVNATRHAGVNTRQMLADIANASAPAERGARRPVVLALAPASEVAGALRTFTSAGVRVRSMVTPALALMSLARLRRRLVAAGMAEAYVALEASRTAIALIRDGSLIAARELPWGYHDSRGLRSRDDVSDRLGGAIEEFFGDCGAPPSAVAQVCICGGMPDMRSMTLALMQRLDVEVEPLDSLFGIDAGHLPDDEFRDHVADMRLAWAAAADRNAPLDFLRERRRRVVKTALTRAAIVAGVATGLGIAWRLQRSALFEPAKQPPKPSPSASAAAPPRPRPAPPPRPVPPPAQPPPVARELPRSPVATEPPPTVVTKAPPPNVVAKAPPPASLGPARMPPPVPPSVPSVAAPSPTARAAAPPPIVLTPVPEPVRPIPPREPAATSPPVVSTTRPARRPPEQEVPLPFEATLGTILYGADRKLAIIDGRIVQVGDDVRGARVVEITQNAVFFRDREGHLRRLSLEDPRR
jgi:hypothetical protein